MNKTDRSAAIEQAISELTYKHFDPKDDATFNSGVAFGIRVGYLAGAASIDRMGIVREAFEDVSRRMRKHSLGGLVQIALKQEIEAVLAAYEEEGKC